MRFSTLFQLSAPPRSPCAPVPLIEVQAREVPAARETLAPELPEDLDARVRLVGEWQLGEG